MLKENIKFIKKFDEELFQKLINTKHIEGEIESVLTKCGLPTLQVLKDSRLLVLHSKYNPLKEAEIIVDNLGNIDKYEHIFFYGLGLGYHVEELLKRYPNKKFTLIEPEIRVFKRYMELRDLTKLPIEDLFFLKVGQSEFETRKFIKEFVDVVREKTLLVTLPSYERLIPEEYQMFITDFKKTVEENRQGILVNYSFQKRWTLNSWINLPETLRTPNILHDVKRDFFIDKPAIIVAAGPSLDEEIENLKFIKINQLAYIFSVGSAINTLIENGIYPDAMCTYDPTQLNQKVFEKVIQRKIDTIPMIYGTSVGYETIKNFHGKKIHMVTSQDTISNYYIELNSNNKTNKVHDAPSIAIVTMELLDKLGSNPIILVGQNLAYKDNKTYSKDMGYEHASDEITEDDINNAIIVKSVEGNEIFTDSSFNRMRSQLEYYIANHMKNKEIINTTKNGAHINGTVYIELSTLINERLEHTKIGREWFETAENSYNLQYVEQKKVEMELNFIELLETLRIVKKTFNKMEQLIVEKKIAKLERMFTKFDDVMKKFVTNDFYVTFLQPMSRVEFDLLSREINSLRYDKDILSKAKKTIKSFKRFINSCEFDIKNMKSIFEDVNSEINELLLQQVKGVKDGK
ncbi:6-hydroxymethylpterin diphosphokinase MptE-like protein [Bacillus sp. 31A1R]|uniref:6-hydroxymethylpterin diphosphokinase MptE-like protein n=1 Tax=Robertmurraya mangrovi TaxID=3098077 RepID=A0ABU5IXR1_9BACI|nr:6-hydroxymethylpterin diphosphokinase MptE-like protein [Bacillus sp. 31A1R]MDZ5471959.1 6-hydroxymethylpterin diphosphokinase MptE-like protein [Bacillus sp. 31A1R]